MPVSFVVPLRWWRFSWCPFAHGAPAFVCEVFAAPPCFIRGAPFDGEVLVVLHSFVVPLLVVIVSWCLHSSCLHSILMLVSVVVPPSLVKFSWCTHSFVVPPSGGDCFVVFAFIVGALLVRGAPFVGEGEVPVVPTLIRHVPSGREQRFQYARTLGRVHKSIALNWMAQNIKKIWQLQFCSIRRKYQNISLAFSKTYQC